MVIQERDRHLLLEIAIMRVIDREQAKIVAQFGSTPRVNSRLLALTRAGLLRRFFLGTSVGARALYSLSLKGAALIGEARRGPQRRKDELLAADAFVSHQLAINQIYCALKYRIAPNAGASFARWVAFDEPLDPRLPLIPDGYVELRTSGDLIGAFLEVDRGHERLKVWREKVRNYLRFALSTDHERRFGTKRFRVLVVASSERKMLWIRKIVKASTDKIFWFAEMESINRQGFFAPVWLRPDRDERRPFLSQNP